MGLYEIVGEGLCLVKMEEAMARPDTTPSGTVVFQCIMVLGDNENCSGGWYLEYFVVAMCIYSGWCCLEMFTGLSEILNIMGWAIFLVFVSTTSVSVVPVA